MIKSVKVILLVLVAGVVLNASAHAAVIWNNGEFDWRHATANGIQNDFYTKIYDDFVVPDGGWTFQSVWSNNILMWGYGQTHYQYTQAFWEIRQDMTTGSNTGTRIAGGVIADADVFWNGVFGWNEQEPSYHFLVDIEDIYLDPGHYWMAVAPYGQGPGQSYICSTSWTRMYTTENVVPEMYGNTYYGWGNYYRLKDGPNLDHFGYSMGANGVAGPVDPTSPEPATLALLGLGLAGAALRRKVRA